MQRPQERTSHTVGWRALAPRAARVFSATTMVKAHRYATGAVELVEVEARTAVASVVGSSPRPYTVNVAAPAILDGLLRVACSCPVGDRLEACKHVFATLLVLDRRPHSSS